MYNWSPCIYVLESGIDELSNIIIDDPVFSEGIDKDNTKLNLDWTLIKGTHSENSSFFSFIFLVRGAITIFS